MTDHHHQVVVEEEGVWLGTEMEWEEGESSYIKREGTNRIIIVGEL